jgi:hypothetical protein
LPVHPRIFNNPEISDDPLDRSFVYSPNQQISESRRLEISDDVNYNYVITQDAAVQEEEMEFKQPRSSLPDTENSSINLGIDWDDDKVWERRVMSYVMDDKRERRQEFQQIAQQREQLEKERHNLAQVMQSIDQKNNDLKAREAKIKDIEPLLPSVRELQSANITVDLILPYIVALNEKSVLEKRGLKETAYHIINELKNYREPGTMMRGIEEARKQFEDMQNFTLLKQEAVLTLLNLEMMGYTEKDIVDLTATLQHGTNLV